MGDALNSRAPEARTPRTAPIVRRLRCVLAADDARVGVGGSRDGEAGHRSRRRDAGARASRGQRDLPHHRPADDYRHRRHAGGAVDPHRVAGAHAHEQFPARARTAAYGIALARIRDGARRLVGTAECPRQSADDRAGGRGRTGGGQAQPDRRGRVAAGRGTNHPRRAAAARAAAQRDHGGAGTCQAAAGSERAGALACRPGGWREAYRPRRGRDRAGQHRGCAAVLPARGADRHCPRRDAAAATHDPRELARWRVQGVLPNLAEARKWYERARELGAPEAEERLARLGGG